MRKNELIKLQLFIFAVIVAGFTLVGAVGLWLIRVWQLIHWL